MMPEEEEDLRNWAAPAEARATAPASRSAAGVASLVGVGAHDGFSATRACHDALDLATGVFGGVFGMGEEVKKRKESEEEW